MLCFTALALVSGLRSRSSLGKLFADLRLKTPLLTCIKGPGCYLPVFHPRARPVPRHEIPPWVRSLC